MSNRVKDYRGISLHAPELQKRPQDGFTLIELAVALGILAVLAGVVLLNLGTFFNTGNAQAKDAERYQVTSAVSMYRVDGFITTQPFTVGPPPLGKKVLDPYLLGNLQYYWNIAIDGKVSPAAAFFFSSDLNSLDGFTSIMGGWTASGGVLSPTGQFQNRLVVNGGPWEDFTFETTATLVSGNSSGYGMYYRCDSNPNITGYIFQFDPGLGNKFVVRKVVGGTEYPPFQTVSMPVGFPVNGQHKVSVSVQGDYHVIKVDGNTVLNFHDSQYSSGTVGLRSWSNSSFTQVNFTEFMVSPQ